jgi:hypothetical protein
MICTFVVDHSRCAKANGMRVTSFPVRFPLIHPCFGLVGRCFGLFTAKIPSLPGKDEKNKRIESLLLLLVVGDLYFSGL